MRCIAVDDEPLALDLLEDNISKIPFFTLVRRCKNAFEAHEAMMKDQIDLIFMDIEMPGISGVQFLQSVVSPPLVIFITAYQEFALEGYSLDAVDYLLKPVSFDRFLKAANKAHEFFTPKNNVSTLPITPSPEYLFVSADYNLIKINIRDIVYIEGLKDYIKIYILNSIRPVITRMGLKVIEEKLPPDRFVRVHKSFIVCVERIVSIRKGKISINNVQVPISEHYKENLHRFVDPDKLSLPKPTEVDLVFSDK
ncbi:MAG: LytTR family DNA-binding domain-containing protein [Chryseolinea sp.]